MSKFEFFATNAALDATFAALTAPPRRMALDEYFSEKRCLHGMPLDEPCAGCRAIQEANAPACLDCGSNEGFTVKRHIDREFDRCWKECVACGARSEEL